MHFSFGRLALLPVLILAFGVFVGAAIVAQAQTDDDSETKARGISFPVAELGNCGSKTECKAYCEDPANMEACIAFAEKHSLMTGEEASRAKKFSAKMKSGGGPGGCKSPKECEAFCSSLNNIEACVAFAEEHGEGGKDIAEAKKVSAYIKSGGQMPGGCTSKESCETYCGDATHAEECIAFAERSGLGPKDGGGRPGDIEKFKKFSALIKSGETPGGCTSKDTCEQYCGNPDNQETCLAFGKKMGFVDEHKEQFFRENRGKGPGGCDSRGSCEAFCNDSANRETCFKFGQENGLLRKEDVEQSKEGLVRLRSGLEQAPPEVAECLKASVGPNIIDDIQAGQLVPGPEIGERVRACFEKAGRRDAPREMFKEAPREVVACASEKLGADTAAKMRSGEAEFTPEAADAFRVCFQQQQFSDPRPGGEGGEGPSAQQFGNFARTAPPEVRNCLESNLGGDFAKLESGEISPDSVKDKLHSCFDSFKPQMPPGAPIQGMPQEGRPDDPNFRGRPEGIGHERPPQQFPRAEYEEKCKADPEACKNFGAPFFEQRRPQEPPSDLQRKPPYMGLPGQGEPPRTGEYQPGTYQGPSGEYRPMEGAQPPQFQQYQQSPTGSTMPPPPASEPSGSTGSELPPPGWPAEFHPPEEQNPPPGTFLYRPSLFARILEAFRGR